MTRYPSSSLLLAAVGVTWVAACAPRVAPPPPRLEASAPKPRPSARPPPGPEPGAPTAGCPKPSVRPFEPNTPFQGVQVYPFARAPERAHFAGQHLFALSEYDGRALIVPLDGGAGRRFPTIFHSSSFNLPEFMPEPRSVILRVGQVWNECGRRGLSALDPSTLERRWELRPQDISPNPPLSGESQKSLGLRSAREIDGKLIVELDPPLRIIAALDVASGRLLWQRAERGGLATGSRWLFVLHDSEIDAVDPMTGEALWTLSLAPDVSVFGAHFSPDGRYAVLPAARDPASTRRRPRPCDGPCLGELAVFSLEQRRELHRVPLPRDERILDYRLLGSDLVIIEACPAGGFRGFAVRALDAESGRVRWTVPSRACGASDVGSYIAGDGDSIYACGCDGVLRVLARRTGEELGYFSVGACRALMDQRGKLVHTSLAVNDAHAEAGVALIGREAFSGPEFSADVSGEISVYRDDMRKDRWVRIGDELVRADGRGRFKARVRGRGVLSADIALREGEEGSGSQALLVLDAPSTHTIELALHDPDEE